MNAIEKEKRERAKRYYRAAKKRKYMKVYNAFKRANRKKAEGVPLTDFEKHALSTYKPKRVFKGRKVQDAMFQGHPFLDQTVYTKPQVCGCGHTHNVEAPGLKTPPVNSATISTMMLGLAITNLIKQEVLRQLSQNPVTHPKVLGHVLRKVETKLKFPNRSHPYVKQDRSFNSAWHKKRFPNMH